MFKTYGCEVYSPISQFYKITRLCQIKNVRLSFKLQLKKTDISTNNVISSTALNIFLSKILRA